MRNTLSFLVVGMLTTAACGGPAATPAMQAERARQRADELHEEGVRIQANARKAERAASLHRESARLRPPSDPRAYACYAQGSDILAAAGRIEHARELMEESAAFALARGDSINAARSYADAVLIAAREGVPRLVIQLAARLQAVAQPPAVSRPDVDALLARVARPLAEAEAAVAASQRGSTH